MPKQKPSSQSSKPINVPMLDLYSDYLISSFGLTTATGMSAALGGAISHEDITRFLSGREYTNKTSGSWSNQPFDGLKPTMAY